MILPNERTWARRRKKKRCPKRVRWGGEKGKEGREAVEKKKGVAGGNALQLCRF
jgi:hypothetical protein